jgi:hypothetical protein
MNGNNAAHFCHELKAGGIVFFYVTSFFLLHAVYQHSATFGLKVFCIEYLAYVSSINTTVGNNPSLANVMRGSREKLRGQRGESQIKLN